MGGQRCAHKNANKEKCLNRCRTVGPKKQQRARKVDCSECVGFHCKGPHRYEGLVYHANSQSKKCPISGIVRDRCKKGCPGCGSSICPNSKVYKSYCTLGCKKCGGGLCTISGLPRQQCKRGCENCGSNICVNSGMQRSICTLGCRNCGTGICAISGEKKRDCILSHDGCGNGIEAAPWLQIKLLVLTRRDDTPRPLGELPSIYQVNDDCIKWLHLLEWNKIAGISIWSAMDQRIGSPCFEEVKTPILYGKLTNLNGKKPTPREACECPHVRVLFPPFSRSQRNPYIVEMYEKRFQELVHERIDGDFPMFVMLNTKGYRGGVAPKRTTLGLPKGVSTEEKLRTTERAGLLYTCGITLIYHNSPFILHAESAQTRAKEPPAKIRKVDPSPAKLSIKRNFK